MVHTIKVYKPKITIMKKINTVCLIAMIGCLSSCLGQTTVKKKEPQPEVETKNVTADKGKNLLDEQTKMYGDIFKMAGAGDDNPVGDAENYLDYIKNMNLSQEQKNLLIEQYKVYDLSLDPTKKDSLQLMTQKMLEKAIEKTQSENSNN